MTLVKGIASPIEDPFIGEHPGDPVRCDSVVVKLKNPSDDSPLSRIWYEEAVHNPVAIGRIVAARLALLPFPVHGGLDSFTDETPLHLGQRGHQGEEEFPDRGLGIQLFRDGMQRGSLSVHELGKLKRLDSVSRACPI